MLGLAPLRCRLLSDPLLRWFRRALPQVSRTEQEALDAASPSPAHAAGHTGGIITPAKTVLLERFERLRRACIMVDDFAPDAGTRPAETSGAMSAANVVAPASKQVSDRIEETHAE